MPPLALAEHGSKPHKRTCQRAKENNKQQALVSQKGSDHGQQLDVAAAHAVSSCEEGIACCNRIKNPSSEKNAKPGFLPADQGIEKGADKTDQDSRQADFVWDNLKMDINKNNSQ